MKRGTPDHPKMKALTRTLGVCRAHAVGTLEMLWHFTAAYAPEGSLAKFTPDEIAESVTWVQDPSKLIEALRATEWLDDDMFIHDWPLHCEDATHMKLARAGHYFACGCSPSSSRLPAAEKHKAPTPNVCARHTHAVCSSSALPLPLPRPLPRPYKTHVSHAEFMLAWNALGKPFSKIRVWTDGRQKHLKARCGDDFWVENWRKALDAMKQSSFCKGGGNTGWVGDVDWFLKADSVAKLIEGKFNDRAPASEIDIVDQICPLRD